METRTLAHIPVAKAEMLIRRPVADVFAAFIDPAITTRFWFTKSSGRMAPGATLTWTWEMYNVSAQVHVTAVDPHRRIVAEWPYNGAMTEIEWVFTPYRPDATFVSITNSGFEGDGDKVVRDALESQGGFRWVLAGLKALLEHGIELNLIADAYPAGLRDR